MIRRWFARKVSANTRRPVSKFSLRAVCISVKRFAGTVAGDKQMIEIVGDRVLRWIPKPATLEHRRFNALRIARLLMSRRLSGWERSFLQSIMPLKKLSPRQQACLDKIYAEHLEGARR
jgi:hypothetical protein